MRKFSENNKIAISAIAVLIVSFSLMITFLGDADFGYTKVDVLHLETGEESVDLEADYRALIENQQDPIFVTNAEGVFSFISEDFCALMEMDCKEIAGDKFFNYVNSKDHADLVMIFTKLVRDGEKIDGIGPFRMSNGETEKLILFSAKPILDKDDKVTEIVFSAKDLTSQAKELNQEEEPVEGTAEEDDGSWTDNLYPKIKEMRDEDGRLMVDKISYTEE